MPGYSHLSLAEAEDVAPRFGLGELLEARFVTKELGCSVVGLSHQRLRPGARQPFGHLHAQQEEVYVVLAGSGVVNLAGELVELAPLDALRVDPGVMRSFEAGPDGLELIAVGAPIADEPDSTIERGWWDA